MGSIIPALPQRAWVTLVTKSSYLPGALLLSYSLHKQKSKYPLLILTTPSFPPSLLPALQQECSLTNAYHHSIESLCPPPENTPAKLIASRFEDTWTKLRVFELYKYGCEKLVFLDADMLVRRNMDELFDVEIPRNWIAANHVCVCNLDNDVWAPEDWNIDNCAYTGLSVHSESREVPNPDNVASGKRTHTLLNSGMFVFSPFEQQWNDILTFLKTDRRVKEYLFPDQDFLADYFEGRWQSASWKYNALKTMRYWHPSMWDDDEVKNVHYIVDKPWSKRIDSDGAAGYLGKDGFAHSWWWKEYCEWEALRYKMGKDDLVAMMNTEVAKPL